MRRCGFLNPSQIPNRTRPRIRLRKHRFHRAVSDAHEIPPRSIYMPRRPSCLAGVLHRGQR